MSKHNLAIVYSRFFARTERLVKSFNAAIPSRPIHGEYCQALQRDAREREVVKLQLCWGQFCRELIIRSAAGRYRTLTGQQLPPGTMSSPSSILTEARSLCRKAYFPWHMPTRCCDLAIRIGAPNAGQIKAGLSVTAPVDDLLAVRNYIEHPSRHSQIRFRRVAIKYGQPQLGPVVLLSTRLSNGRTLFEHWVESFRLMAEIAVR